MVARAGDLVVRKSEYEADLGKRGYDPAKLPKNYREPLLRALLRNKMKLELIRKSGVEQDPAIQRTLKTMRDNLLVSAYQERIPVTDAEAMDYFTKHPENFQPPNVTISHVRVKSLADAKKAINQLQKGRPVAGWKKDVVHQFQPSGGSFDPAFVRAVYALKPGQLSSPIQSAGGFEIVKRLLEPVPGFSEVKPRVYAILRSQKFALSADKALAASQIKFSDSEN